ncbi:HNH endonuclease [Cyclobacterium sp. 1_MG-2023]|uniref:HNH endonuclease n=1 Tax=Cyclobacterium sp. 1_MG-2023 TaxID=3062681 RepID=UPI0026E2DEC3|nr:HNH endonuclease [Cyclobacterium sp. 1_MG-2023]MDO6437321.1 HNH endonuclease [Cyclobacterium sp. 1_MG-2023]
MRFIEKNIKTNSLVIEAKNILETSGHYNHSDRVRDIIRILYSGCCAFCESSIEDSSFFQIEHFYPKNIAIYKQYDKSIENLHYSCQRCNTLKGRKLQTKIFSPNYFLNSNQWIETIEEKIENEMYYIGYLLFSYNSTKKSIDRGNETIKLFDLNNFNGFGRSSRQHLVESRLRVFDKIYNILNVIFEMLIRYDKKNNDAIELLFSIVSRHTNRTSHFSTMVIHNFGSDLIKLLEIYSIKKNTVGNKR